MNDPLGIHYVEKRNKNNFATCAKSPYIQFVMGPILLPILTVLISDNGTDKQTDIQKGIIKSSSKGHIIPTNN